ncbi:amidase family protein [Streptomyces longhuiensis]|uniref:amidase family protein n=1 Tax=Streptomyces sp. NPDC001893 TaxID=3154530 RepID=UPI00311B2FFB
MGCGEVPQQSAEQPERLSTPLAELLASGREIAEADNRSALSFRHRARTETLSLLTDVDAILGPAAPAAAPKGLTATGSPTLSRPWQLRGLPALTVLGRTNDQDMPLGLQLIGQPHRLDHPFEFGRALEAAARARRADRSPGTEDT